jgi:hypothetical protein
MGASAHNEDDYADPEFIRPSKEQLANMSPAQREKYAAKIYAKQNNMIGRNTTPGYEVCCPHC